MIWAYSVTFFVPLLVALVLTPAVARLASRLQVVDLPGGRRRHHGVVPRMGGLAPVIGFLVAVALPVAWPQHFPPIADPNQPIWFRGLVLGTLVAALGGLWDDVRDLAPRYQLSVQFLCAVIAIWATLFIERVNNPFTNEQIVFPRPLVWAFTIFWVMGMMNTVNWLDGVDGLASSVAGVFAVVLIVHLTQRELYSVALWPVALLGAVLGFLPYNWPPARVFLGSVGTYGVGYIMAVLGIAAGAKVATVLLVLGLPIADVAWQIVRRWRSGHSLFVGDRGHLHHRLYDRGWSPRRIVLLYVGWGIVMGTLALVVSSRVLKLGLLVTVGILSIVMFLWATRHPPHHSADG